MICTCRICGKKYDGRPNSCICSDVCRREAQRIYQKEYRMRNPDKSRKAKLDYWNKKKLENLAFKKELKSDNIDLDAPKPKPKSKSKPKTKDHKPININSKWAEIYNSADRLTKLSMLSEALIKHDIAKLSYGKLSLIWLTDEYYRLLQQVLKIRAEEEKKQKEMKL